MPEDNAHQNSKRKIARTNFFNPIMDPKHLMLEAFREVFNHIPSSHHGETSKLLTVLWNNLSRLNAKELSMLSDGFCDLNKIEDNALKTQLLLESNRYLSEALKIIMNIWKINSSTSPVYIQKNIEIEAELKKLQKLTHHYHAKAISCIWKSHEHLMSSSLLTASAAVGAIAGTSVSLGLMASYGGLAAAATALSITSGGLFPIFIVGGLLAGIFIGIIVDMIKTASIAAYKIPPTLEKIKKIERSVEELAKTPSTPKPIERNVEALAKTPSTPRPKA